MPRKGPTEQRLPRPVAGIESRLINIDFEELGRFVKYIIAKAALTERLMKLEDGVNKLKLTPAQKDRLLRRIKRVIKKVETCRLDDLLEAIDEADPSKIDELPAGTFRKDLSAAYEFAKLIYLKRYHDTHAPARPVKFEFDAKKRQVTVSLGNVEFTYKCDASKVKEAEEFVKKLQDRLTACTYSTHEDGEKWRDLFTPAGDQE
jgi:hypothetical protein